MKSIESTWSFLVVVARVGLHCHGSLGDRSRRIDAVHGSVRAVGNGHIFAHKDSFGTGCIGWSWTGVSVLAASHFPDTEM